MIISRDHVLVGLEPDNLLAFLALLGLLRSLDSACPDWRARIHWQIERPPIRPVLTLRHPATPTTVAEAAARGCKLLANTCDFGDLKSVLVPLEYARRLLEQASFAGPANRSRADVLAALFSDIAVKDDRVTPTPFCLLFGQGHQHFLDRFSAVAKQDAVRPIGARAKGRASSPTDVMTRALFHPWERTDQTPGFRWDPAEDRRYALRFNDPSKDPAMTVHGANRLAVIGLPILTAYPVTNANRVRLSAVGVRRVRNRHLEVTWPIWTRSASLQAVRALLTHPLIYSDAPDRSRLQALGIHEIRRARRISVGKFLNFTRAVPV